MNKILIVGPSWIGDAVMAQTLFKVIKQRDPNAIIHVVAPTWVMPILDFMPEIDISIVWPFAHGELNFSKRYQFGKSLRKKHYTQAIVLPNSFKSALVSFWAGIPMRTGWRGEMRYGLLNDIRILDKTNLPLMVQRYAALGFDKEESLPIPNEFQVLARRKRKRAPECTPCYMRSELSLQQSQNLKGEGYKQLPFPQLVLKKDFNNKIDKKFNLINLTKPVLALCPGGEYGKAKRWPVEYFAEVARQKLNAGWQVWLLGGKNDKFITDEINQLTEKACTNFAGETALDEAVVLLSKAQMVIANDTGLMHVAAALQRPLIVIYGSTSPKFAPPLSESARIVTANLECSPCCKRSCPLKRNRYRCLTAISPEMVLKAIEIFYCNRVTSGV